MSAERGGWVKGRPWGNLQLNRGKDASDKRLTMGLKKPGFKDRCSILRESRTQESVGFLNEMPSCLENRRGRFLQNAPNILLHSKGRELNLSVGAGPPRVSLRKGGRSRSRSRGLRGGDNGTRTGQKPQTDKQTIKQTNSTSLLPNSGFFLLFSQLLGTIEDIQNIHIIFSFNIPSIRTIYTM